MTAHIFTIDVEDWFHILDLDSTPSVEDWSALESRVERNLHVLLDLLDERQVKATCFFLGWVARTSPRLVRETLARGHEIACHGYAHQMVHSMSPEAFRADIRLAKLVVEDGAGSPVRGYRAPGFSITHATPWAWDILAEEGYLYDSSVFPGRHGHGGMPGAPVGPHRRAAGGGELVEMPIRPAQTLGRSFMFSGGGYFRLLPVSMVTLLADRIARVASPVIYYIHPREIDTDQPRLPMPLLRRFKSYVNLSTTRGKLELLLARYDFTRMIDWIDAHGERLAPLPAALPAPR